jgi:hypothetical protein
MQPPSHQITMFSTLADGFQSQTTQSIIGGPREAGHDETGARHQTSIARRMKSSTITLAVSHLALHLRAELQLRQARIER